VIKLAFLVPTCPVWVVKYKERSLFDAKDKHAPGKGIKEFVKI
jgi:hypothetical protein